MARVWFITGTSRGLGYSIAVAALRDGDSVVATARNPATLQRLVDSYGADRVLPVALDVSDNEQVLTAVAKAVEKFGRIDVVVNNAGYGHTAAVEDISLADFRAAMDANFYGAVYVTKAVLPILRTQRSGHIIQISSVGGRVGSPGLAAYQSAKWAIAGFSTVLNKEVAPLGIKVTVLEPGGMKTDWAGASMLGQEPSEAYAPTIKAMSQLRDTMVGKGAEPESVADIVLTVLKLEEPPLRLLAGADTVAYAKMAADELAASDEKWRSLTESTADERWVKKVYRD